MGLSGGTPTPFGAATPGPTSPPGSPPPAASGTATAGVTASPALSATPGPLTTAEITQRYNNALQATAEAIVATLPTLTPRPDVPPAVAERQQKGDLWTKALSTAVVLYAPPPEYDPRSLDPPTHPPYPTAAPRFPRRPLAGGTLLSLGGIPAEGACMSMRPVNVWIGHLGGGPGMDICAGLVQDLQSEAGELLVSVATGDIDNPVDMWGAYPPPELGAIWIEDMQGTLLLLQSKAGQPLAFDLATRQWVPPTPGPTPSQAPSPTP